MSAVAATETPQAAARRLIAEAIRADEALDPTDRKGWRPEALHTWTNAAGDPLYWTIKARLPSGNKVMRPMFSDGGRFRLGRPKFERGQAPLYRLEHLTLAPGADPVLIVEGESCADALARLGLVATTSGSASSAAAADWTPLAGREVLIWPDNDDPGRAYAAEVAAILRGLGCRVRMLDPAALGLAKGGDCADWLHERPGATAAAVLALPWVDLEDAPAQQADTPAADEGEPEGRRSQADQLVAFVAERYELFRDDSKAAYALERSTGITRRLEGRAFRDRIAAAFFEAEGRAVRDQALREARITLGGLAQVDERAVHVRVAGADRAYWLDLGRDGDAQAVRLEPGRWTVAPAEPIFCRSESMQPLPVPTSSEDGIGPLWRVANVAPADRLIVIAWLIDCLRPDTPFPVLELLGEQGSAKSTTQTALRRLIDPNAADLRAPPRTPEDCFISASAAHMLSLENVSHLKPEIQDALCVIATGGATARRMLYTDADESVIRCKRPIILNGIGAAVTQQDLVSRALSIELPTIRDAQARGDLEADFERSRGQILGALLDIAARALDILPRMALPAEQRPRLLEFALLGMATAEAMGQDRREFMDAFRRVQRVGVERTLEGSPVAVAILSYLESRGHGAFEMSAGDWHTQLDAFRPPGAGDAWPRTPKGMGDAFRRLAPALRQVGIDCTALGNVGGRVRWRVNSKENFQTMS